VDIEIENPLLAHLQILILNTLRKNHPLLMSWLDSPRIAKGRSAVRLGPTIRLYFEFAGSRSPQIDPAWLRALTESGESSTGLILRNAGGELAHAAGKRAG